MKNDHAKSENDMVCSLHESLNQNTDKEAHWEKAYLLLNMGQPAIVQFGAIVLIAGDDSLLTMHIARFLANVKLFARQLKMLKDNDN